ncbi:MAG: hypothetical protein QXX19_08785 [Candidatus Caldarchaeum sp.]
MLPDEDAERAGDLSIIDESGEDYLYPADYFVLADFPSKVVQVLNKSFVQHAPEQFAQLPFRVSEITSSEILR